MRQPVHSIGGHKPMTPERIAGIGFVALLHVVAIWAIVSGLVPKIFKPAPPPDLVVVRVPDKEVPPPPAPKMPSVNVPNPTVVDNVPPPDVKIQQDPTPLPPAKLGPTQQILTPSVPDTAAISIADTHTTPPYPPNERRMGFQGTVTLHLTISPQGVVTMADIVKSSGSTGLDQAALSWVMSHWKYKPAIQNGAPVESHADANVVFNLRNAG